MSPLFSSPKSHRQSSGSSIASQNHSVLVCPDSAFHYASNLLESDASFIIFDQRQCNEKASNVRSYASTSRASLSPKTCTATSPLQRINVVSLPSAALDKEATMEVPKVDSALTNDFSKPSTSTASISPADEEYDPSNPLNFSDLKKWIIVIVIANGAFCVTCCACLITVGSQTAF